MPRSALSDELMARYASEVDVDWRSAFVLDHPTAGRHYLIDHSEYYTGLFNGEEHVFAPVPTQITLPSTDDSGRQDLTVAWFGILEQGREYVDAVSVNSSEPITCYYSVFILPEGMTPQIDPWMEFKVTSVTLSLEGVVISASRTDIINRMFPTEVYRVDLFPGLRRQ